MRKSARWLSVGVLLCALVLTVVPAMADSVWRQANGPVGATINALAVSPSSSQIVYLGTDGGLFKSNNSGQYWSMISSGALTNGDTPKTIWTLAIDPAGAIYAGTSEGVYKSTNAGASWTLTTAPASVLAFAIDPNNSQVMYAGSGNTIYKSMDGGRTWSAKYAFSSLRGIVVDPTNSQNVYVGTSKGVFKSTDGGDSWLASSNGLYGGWSLTKDILFVYTLAIDARGTVYAATYGGLFQSTDGGASWHYDNPPASSVVNVASTDPTNPDIVYAGIWYGRGIFKSTDGGGTWSLVTNGGTKSLISYSPAGGVWITPSDAAPKTPLGGMEITLATSLFIAGYGFWKSRKA